MNPGRPYGHGILIPAPLTRLGRPRKRPITGDPGLIKNPSGLAIRTRQLLDRLMNVPVPLRI